MCECVYVFVILCFHIVGRMERSERASKEGQKDRHGTNMNADLRWFGVPCVCVYVCLRSKFVFCKVAIHRQGTSRRSFMSWSHTTEKIFLVGV